MFLANCFFSGVQRSRNGIRLGAGDSDNSMDRSAKTVRSGTVARLHIRCIVLRCSPSKDASFVMDRLFA